MAVFSFALFQLETLVHFPFFFSMRTNLHWETEKQAGWNAVLTLGHDTHRNNVIRTIPDIMHVIGGRFSGIAEATWFFHKLVAGILGAAYLASVIALYWPDCPQQ
jgi:hypothetical protein